jgi:hypothetical protein
VIDDQGLRSLRASLRPDGYDVEVREHGRRVAVRITAGPDACADCLAPEPVLKGIVGKLLKVPEEAIDLTYPRDHTTDDGGAT